MIRGAAPANIKRHISTFSPDLCRVCGAVVEVSSVEKAQV